MASDQPLPPEPEPSSRINLPLWIWIGGWAVLLLCACLIIAGSMVGYFSTFSPASRPALPQPAAPATPPAGWKSQLIDTFVGNDNGWPVGEKTYTEGQVLRQVDQYVFHVDVQNKDNEEWYSFPDDSDVDLQLTDQYVSVDAHLTSPYQSGVYYGLLVRYANNDNFYEVTLSDDGYWSIDSQVADEWQSLVAWTRTRDLMPNQMNHLAVLAEGDRISVFINGHYQGGVTDDHTPKGKAGLIVASDAGQHVTIDFDNFEVQTP